MKLMTSTIIATLVLAGTSTMAAGDAKAGAAKATVCFACHGPNGNSTNPMYPVLAGKDAKFIVEQLKAFKSGTRKTPNAGLMKPMAAPLSDADMENLAAFFSTQTAAPAKKR